MDNKFCGLSFIRRVSKENNLRVSKTLGQNFLINKDICKKIAKSSGISKKIGVLEIGPGLGSLTFELAKISKKVVSIEIDKRLIDPLKNNFKNFDNVEIIQGDIEKFDIKKLIEKEFDSDVVMCSNLPYYLTSPIVMRFLEEKIPVKSLTVMIQKEAAERFCQTPGVKGCGAISCAIDYFSVPSILFGVSKNNFFPIPNVDSSVIKLDIRRIPKVNPYDEKLFFKVIKAAFSEKRKAIKNPLSTRTEFSKEKIIKALELSFISPMKRAEHLTLEDFSLFTKNLIDINQ